jgi:hypothetical protein
MTKRTITSPEFEKHGYELDAELQVLHDRYIVTLTLQTGEEREVAWEPAEPERQAQAVRFADRDPVGAVLDAIEIDKGRRAEEREAHVRDILQEAQAEDAREHGRFDREGFANYFLADWRRDPDAVEQAWILYDERRAEEG